MCKVSSLLWLCERMLFFFSVFFHSSILTKITCSKPTKRLFYLHQECKTCLRVCWVKKRQEDNECLCSVSKGQNTNKHTTGGAFMGNCEVTFCKTLFGRTVFSAYGTNMWNSPDMYSWIFSLSFYGLFIDVCAPCCFVCGVVCGRALQTSFG